MMWILLYITLVFFSANIDGRKTLKSESELEAMEESQDSNAKMSNRKHGPVEIPSPSRQPPELSLVSSEAAAVTTTYIRWGRTDCPSASGAKTVYFGYAAGQFYAHSGGGVGPICLPAPSSMELEYLEIQPGFQGAGYLYGAEYETNYFQALNDVHDCNVPCAVCEVNGRSSTMMIPGVLRCPSGWKKEYQGYLMTAHFNHASQTQYSCVDDEMKYFRGTRADNNGLLFYTIEIANHPSLCPPFACNGQELACVVCTK